MNDKIDIAAITEGDGHEVRSRLDRWIANSSKILAWAIFVAFLVSVFEVISRYVFDSPTFWAHETTTFLIAAIFLIGGPVALARDKHIRVRMFYDTVSPRAKRWLDIFNSIVAMCFFAGLGYAGWVMAWKATHNPLGEIHLEGTGTAWNPPTPALLKITILICVSLMFIQTALHLVAAIRRDVSGVAAGEK